MNNNYFSQVLNIQTATLREAVEMYTEHLKKVGDDPHLDKKYADYHRMYYEIISGYLESAKNLQPLIENIVMQIHVRFPWANGTTKDALGMIGAELSHILEKHSIHTVRFDDE
jgi:hypothetical protein